MLNTRRPFKHHGGRCVCATHNTIHLVDKTAILWYFFKSKFNRKSVVFENCSVQLKIKSARPPLYPLLVKDGNKDNNTGGQDGTYSTSV